MRFCEWGSVARFVKIYAKGKLMYRLEEVIQGEKIKPLLDTLPLKKRSIFLSVLYETAEDSNSRLLQCQSYIQHGCTTVLMHVILVALTAFSLALKYNIKVNEESLIRGALLHDYFLYDWHETSWANSIHGFTHPGKALKCAQEDFNLTKIEENMILHHMFPLTPIPPTTKEGLLLCLADKICATKETVHRKQ